MPLFSKIQRYILKECLMGLALVLGILLLAILMIDVVEQLREGDKMNLVTVKSSH